MTDTTTPTPTPPLENLEKLGEKPKHAAVVALAADLPQDSLTAAALLGELTSTMVDALPGASQRNLAGYLNPEATEAQAIRQRDAKAAQALADAASYRATADSRLAKAKALKAMVPGDYAVMVARDAAKQAQHDAEREKRRGAGSVSVSVYTDIDVEVNKEDLAGAGYHHKSECQGTGDASRSPDHELILDVWNSLRDFHDNAHGLTSWAGCPDPACVAVPEQFQLEPWHHIDASRDEW